MARLSQQALAKIRSKLPESSTFLDRGNELLFLHHQLLATPTSHHVNCSLRTMSSHSVCYMKEAFWCASGNFQ
jgi:hypothetical protein